MTFAAAAAHCHGQWRYAEDSLRRRIAEADGQAAWYRRIRQERYYDDDDLTDTPARAGLPRQVSPGAPQEDPPAGGAVPRDAAGPVAAPADPRSAESMRRARLRFLEVCAEALRGAGVSVEEALRICDEAWHGSLVAIRLLQALLGHGPWVNGHGYPGPGPTPPPQGGSPAGPEAPAGNQATE